MELRDGAGRPVQLGARLGRGGEGEVFEVVGQPGIAAKVLHQGRADGKAEKVRQMLAHPPAGAYDSVEGQPVLTWPREVLADRDRRVVGYTMARVPHEAFVPFFRLTSSSRRRGLGGPPLSWDRQVLLGMRLCHLVRTLHRFGYAVGDLNDRNVLVSRRLTPLLMDTDSFQVPRSGRGHHACVVGDQLYWPPELLDVDLARHAGSRETGDRFALGVLLFQLFMDGLRPYQARGRLVDGLETVAQKTGAGRFPWAKPRPGVCEPPAAAPLYAALPKSVRAAFERCFVDGHRKPSRRPTAQEWHETLERIVAGGFRTCATDARHVFAAETRACPWCADPNDRYGHARARTRPAVRAPRRLVLAPPPRSGGKRTSTQGRPARPRVPTIPLPPPVPPAAPLEMVAQVAAPKAAVPVRSRAPPPHTTKGAQVARRPQSRRAILAKPTAQGSATPKPPERKRPRPARRKRKSPFVARWEVRAAWLAVVVLALAVPALLLQTAVDGVDKRVLAVACAIAALATGGVLAARRMRSPQMRTWGTRIAVVMAACVGAALIAAGSWQTLFWIAGLGWTLAALTTFAWLEARDRKPFRPDGRGWMHAALAVPVAAFPIVVLWGWRMLAG